MSPLNILYANVSLSIYMRSVIPGNSFVTLLCLFSKDVLCFILYCTILAWRSLCGL